MNRLALALLLLCPMGVSAQTWTCPGGNPPTDAQPAEPRIEEARVQLIERMRVTQSVARADSVNRVCTLPRVIFYDGDWLTEADFFGPPDLAPGLALLAWTVGGHLHAHDGGLAGRWPTPDEAGAWFSGCTLARSGFDAAVREALLPVVRNRTSPHADVNKWADTFRKGHDECAKTVQ